tara:strand:+ start:365 stop:991 length:627 start_codon:yes stop_codon:yes gene_type:complete
MKKKQVTIIDYGMGNLASIKNALEYLNTNVIISEEPDLISKSNFSILPGVGSFKTAMLKIRKKNIDEAIFNLLKKGNYLLGICLGMQILGKSSTEDGFTEGLGLVDNEVIKFEKSNTEGNKIPHIGFNSVNFDTGNVLFKNLNNNIDFYFVHSYFMQTKGLKKNISTTNYGINFLSSFNNDNIFATQFHPEKSQKNGLILLKNFLNLI